MNAVSGLLIIITNRQQMHNLPMANTNKELFSQCFKHYCRMLEGCKDVYKIFWEGAACNTLLLILWEINGLDRICRMAFNMKSWILSAQFRYAYVAYFFIFASDISILKRSAVRDIRTISYNIVTSNRPFFFFVTGFCHGQKSFIKPGNFEQKYN